MLRTMTYSYPHNTLSIMKHRNSICYKISDFILNIYTVFKLSLLMILISSLMVGSLFIVVGFPYFLISIFI